MARQQIPQIGKLSVEDDFLTAEQRESVNGGRGGTKATLNVPSDEPISYDFSSCFYVTNPRFRLPRPDETRVWLWRGISLRDESHLEVTHVLHAESGKGTQNNIKIPQVLPCNPYSTTVRWTDYKEHGAWYHKLDWHFTLLDSVANDRRTSSAARREIILISTRKIVFLQSLFTVSYLAEEFIRTRKCRKAHSKIFCARLGFFVTVFCSLFF